MTTPQPVEFLSEGVTVRGDLYLPEGDGPFPTIVMAGGWCYVKELRQPQYAQEFVDRGYAALIFDYRNIGASAGTRRQHLDPWAQVEDYRNAISWVETRPELDADRIAAWGISYSGGHVIILAATDPRVKVAVGNVPVVDGLTCMRRSHGSLRFRQLEQALLDDQRLRFTKGEGATIPMSGTPSGPDAELVCWPFEEVKKVFMELKATQAPSHEHWSTLESVQLLTQYDVRPFAKRVVNKPVMLIVAADDDITPWEQQTETFQSLRTEQKELVVLPSTSHMTLYSDLTALDLAARAAGTFFDKHLMRAPTVESEAARYTRA